ncbi:MAG: MFS transporter, partial [Phyllobacteriaceae bacterium]|nr:MFS transporter [Phyllobacteriaceae bacterium]
MTTQRRLLFLALFPFACGYFLSYLLRAVNAVVAPELVSEFAIGPAELGLLTSAYLLTFSAFQLPLGVLLDRFGPRRVQSVLLLIAAAGCLAFALAPGFVGLFFARALIGLGFSAGLMASYKASSIWVPLERRSLANATIMSMGALGLVVATEPTALLTAAIGWRNVFLVFAIIIAAASAFIFFAVPEKDGGTTPASLKQQWGELAAILKLPLFWRVAPLLGLTAGIPIAYQTLWAGPWFRDVIGLAPLDVARNLFWMAVAFMIGIFTIGIVADRLQKRGIGAMTTMTGFLVIHIIAQLAIVLQVTSIALPAWLALAAVGQVAILAFPWFAKEVGENLSGRANATINFAMFVVAFAAQYGVGLVIGRFAPTATGYDPQAYVWAFGGLLLLQLAAMI